MGVLLIVVGIALIILSALLMLAKPVLGGIGVIIGILAVLYGRKTKNQPKKTKKELKTEIKESKVFTVAGFDYYQNELKSLMKEPTYEYSLSDKQFKEEVFGRAYEYELEWYDAHLVPEPENEFDENAIAVYAIDKDPLEKRDIKIGYVARKDQQAITDGKCEVEIYGGKYKELEVDEWENEKIIKGETPYKARLYIEN